jgi:threonine synthase
MFGSPPFHGWRCAVCGATTEVTQSFSWRCPGSSDGDRHHAPLLQQPITPLRSNGDDNPFLAFRRYLAFDAYAEGLGLSESQRVDLIAELDAQVAAVAGTGFRTTPFFRSDRLSHALAFTGDGGVWVKDDTHNVAGSHKARHLFGILLHLVATERAGRAPWGSVDERAPLAIASCGNAALAASTLAAAVRWPIRVFVPVGANPRVVARLHELDAQVVECPRLESDPPGDPCVHRFREAVAAGAVPFSVQGTENAWCHDGGRTIGWEMARHMEEQIEGHPFDRLFVQVGGGAFAASVMAGFGMSGITPRLHAVQTESCAPLARAWERAEGLGGATAAAAPWNDCMWPWENVGVSAADGILDDETYDWIPVLRSMQGGHGSPVVAAEHHVLEANELVRTHTSIDPSHTGTAGVAGLLAIRQQIGAHERVAVIVSGIRR